MENVMKFEDFLNESKSRSFKEKIIELYKKVKHLFGEVKIEITEEKAKEIEKISSIDSLKNIKFDKNIFNRVNKIVKENKKEIDIAYNEVFGMNESLLSILSLLLMGGMVYFAYDNWKKNKLAREEMTGKKEPSIVDTAKEKFKKITAPKVELPKKKMNYDDVLDKISKKGIKSLTPEEKEILKRIR